MISVVTVLFALPKIPFLLPVGYVSADVRRNAWLVSKYRLAVEAECWIHADQKGKVK